MIDINKEWEGYKTTCLHPDANKDQEKEVHQAFIAGCIVIADTLQGLDKLELTDQLKVIIAPWIEDKT